MSALSRFLTGVIIIGLAFIASLRLYRGYERRVQMEQAALEDQQGSTLFNGGVRAPVMQMPVFRSNAALSADANQEIYLQDVTLSAQTNKEQARETLRSILSDYKDNPELKAFYAELQQSTGQPLDLVSLSGENMADLLTKYPQIQEIISRHSQDPSFSKTVQEIFSNPQFIRSVVILQEEK